MLQIKILIRKRLCAVDACRTSAIAVKEVTTLTHEARDLLPVSTQSPPFFSFGEEGFTHNPMKLGPLIPLGPTQVVLGLSGAKLPEILRRPGNDVLEQLKGDAAEGFACQTRKLACSSFHNCGW